ncbi:hypothetical protein FACS189413_10950 [Bacteroidia bacterium]|nr:hypothetical protein FACS189413_10950 [Bacteroidia bacterium]
MLLIIVGRSTCVQAQVAIGGDQDPHPAAILDLSVLGPQKLGFLMPRAILRTDERDFVLNTNAESDKSKASGMLVYNMSNLRPRGVYVWSGDQWISLSNLATSAGDCKTVWDIDGNVYHAKKFGDQCWMTDNLRVSRSKTGRMLSNVLVNSPYGEGEYYRTATVQWANHQVNYYPSADASLKYGSKNPVDAEMVPYDLDFNAFANQFGFHYAWEDAKQACPDGWKLPAAADFNALAAGYGGTTVAGKYLKANNRWYYQSAPDGTDGSNLLKGYQWGGFEPNDLNNVGFNGLPNGFIQADGALPVEDEYDEPRSRAIGELVRVSVRAYSFGRYAHWWVSDQRNDKVLAATGSGNEGLFPVNALSQHSAALNDTYRLGVRCIKE